MKILRGVLLTYLFIAVCCRGRGDADYREIAGETMGTYFKITYQPAAETIPRGSIEHLLERLNAALSTYQPTSTISRFNQSDHGIGSDEIADSQLARYFVENVVLSQVTYERSSGSFDPTVMPLVNYWGFGYEGRKVTEIDTQSIDSLRSFVGFDKIIFHRAESKWDLKKKDVRTQLDFSAVAKGYAIDVLSRFLEDSFHLKNYLVDIGGEARAKGVNRQGEWWRVGINSPAEGSALGSFDFIVQLKDRAIATSGNYRNVYEIEGQKISHTINPKTGFFERNDLLSASVLAENCGLADASATACMALGYAQAKDFVHRDPRLSTVLIYVDSNQQIKYYLTPDLEQFVRPSNN